MRVSSSPLGAFQPQRRGVRLGKCQARRKVKSACAPGAMGRLRQRAPTGPILAGSGSSSPSAEKSSQKSMGEFHQRSRGPPRREGPGAPGGGESEADAEWEEQANESLFHRQGITN